MPDWVKYVRQHLSLRNCPPEREARIVEELAEQLEDAYQEGLHLGLSEQQAVLVAIGLHSRMISGTRGSVRPGGCDIRSRPIMRCLR